MTIIEIFEPVIPEAPATPAKSPAFTRIVPSTAESAVAAPTKLKTFKPPSMKMLPVPVTAAPVFRRLVAEPAPAATTAFKLAPPKTIALNGLR